MKVRIETERLLLRNLVPEDCEAAYKWCGDPKVNTYMIYMLYHNAEDVRSWIESQNQDDPDNCDVGFVLKSTGELIGSGGLYYKPDRDVWTIGYNLRADMWGHGYTAEAIQALIEYINSIRPISVIEGEFAVENHNSQRVMEKLGMVYDRDAEYEKMDGSVRFPAKVFRKELTDKEPGRRRIRIDTRSPRCFFAVSAKLMRHPSEWYRHSLFVECF